MPRSTWHTVAALLIAAPMSLRAQAPVIQPIGEVTDPFIRALFAEGRFVSLDNLPGARGSGYSVRLWSVMVEGDCVDETHAVCSGAYYLSLRADGEYADAALFSLGMYGELRLLRFVHRNGTSLAIEGEIGSFPRTTRPLAPGHRRSTRRVIITLAPNSVSRDSLAIAPLP